MLKIKILSYNEKEAIDESAHASAGTLKIIPKELQLLQKVIGKLQ